MVAKLESNAASKARISLSDLPAFERDFIMFLFLGCEYRTKFSYDADGNLTRDGRFTNEWNAENRLIGVTTLGNLPAEVPVVSLAMEYDHQGRRIAQFRYVPDGENWALDETRCFIYDGWNLVGETRTADSVTVTNWYVWGLDLSGTIQGAGGVGGLLFGSFGGTTSVSSAYYSFDGNGNVSELVGTNGAVLAHYEYDPFGNMTTEAGALAAKNPFRFSAKYWDGDTKTLAYQLRDYSPGMGRWLSRDPIGEDGGLNQYAAFENSPVSAWDVLGLWMSGDHEAMTKSSFASAFPSIPPSLKSCADSVQNWLVHWNKQQDKGSNFDDNSRHFNRAIDSPQGSGVPAAIKAYTDYLVQENGRFDCPISYSDTPGVEDCRESLKALGLMTHTWQDYYMHSGMFVKGLFGGFSVSVQLWTNKKGAVTGSPDSPAGSTGNIIPLSWGLPSGGEHGWIGGEPVSGKEALARRAAAEQFVADKYKDLLMKWATKCRCHCPSLGAAR